MNNTILQKKLLQFLFIFFLHLFSPVSAQMMRLPETDVNYKCKTSRTLGVTEIGISWNAPGVKDREGKIWGTDVAWYGFKVLGFGSNTASPWRAGADECTKISFSTDVTINGKKLPAGNYAFFIAVYPDSCTLIFNKNTSEWGSYFYDSLSDVLRVNTIPLKNTGSFTERLEYKFSKQTENSVIISLDWEKWQIPITVTINRVQTTLEYIQSQMRGAAGFDPPSLQEAAAWCLQHQVNLVQALNWINSVTDPGLGGVKSFGAMATRAGILKLLDRNSEADQLMQKAMDMATVNEIHNYARQLLSENKLPEAMKYFEYNYKKFNGIWPTHAGLMRGYSAMGDFKNALEHAKAALAQAPTEDLKKIMAAAVEKLSMGKPL